MVYTIYSPNIYHIRCKFVALAELCRNSIGMD